METSAIRRLTIVVPCYNCAPTICHTVDEVLAVLGARYELEIVLVDDGSHDGTWEQLMALHQRGPRVKAVCHARNFGEHNAVMTGLRFATGEAVAIIDDDLQHDPAEIIKLVTELDRGYDVVYGRYIVKQHSWFRNLASHLNDRVANLALGKPRDLYLSSFKVIRQCIVRELVGTFSPFPYIDGRILWLTDRLGQVEVVHRERAHGRSAYTLRRLVLLHLNMITGFSILPLRLASLLGLLFACLGLLLSVLFIVERIVDPELPWGWTTTILVLLVGGGTMLFMMGIVGEYLGRVFMILNRKPQAVVRKALE